MKKIKVYRVFGWVLFWYGIIGYVSYSLYKGGKGIDFLLPTILGALNELAFNVFLWAGLILLWLADRNENPDKKSKWVKFIIIYGVFTLINIGLIIAAIIIPNLARR